MPNTEFQTVEECEAFMDRIERDGVQDEIYAKFKARLAETYDSATVDRIMKMEFGQK